jgi:hypothetical protein
VSFFSIEYCTHKKEGGAASVGKIHFLPESGSQNYQPTTHQHLPVNLSFLSCYEAPQEDQKEIESLYFQTDRSTAKLSELAMHYTVSVVNDEKN